MDLRRCYMMIETGLILNMIGTNDELIVLDIPRSGHPPVSDDDEHVQTVSALVETDRNLTIRELAQDTGLAPSTVLHNLKDRLKMRKIASKWVPHDLMDMQKWQRYDTSRNLLQHYEVFL
ncbi:hypothetical protein ANN_19257 [Periplaneta americana]|uniref:Uncharacterized protein n=1 Tax=Periplaneta americana TaxID=6978 RepID=A0ABQ8S9P2_PERAM|nr:hypothetical protein ANN_19257 [Periplaneta americana]